MNYVEVAIPFFILAMAIEFLYGLLVRKQTYRLNDTVNSLQLGVLSRLVDILRLSFAAVVLGTLVQWLGVPKWPMDAAWQWAAAFVAYDFCYYWSILIMAMSEIIGQDVESESKKNLDAALRPYKDENRRLRDENGEFKAKLEASQLEIESLKASKQESIVEQSLDTLDSYEKYVELNSSRNGSGAVLPPELMSKYGKSRSTAYNWYNRYTTEAVKAMKETDITGG